MRPHRRHLLPVWERLKSLHKVRDFLCLVGRKQRDKNQCPWLNNLIPKTRASHGLSPSLSFPVCIATFLSLPSFFFKGGREYTCSFSLSEETPGLVYTSKKSTQPFQRTGAEGKPSHIPERGSEDNTAGSLQCPGCHPLAQLLCSCWCLAADNTRAKKLFKGLACLCWESYSREQEPKCTGRNPNGLVGSAKDSTGILIFCQKYKSVLMNLSCLLASRYRPRISCSFSLEYQRCEEICNS